MMYNIVIMLYFSLSQLQSKLCSRNYAGVVVTNDWCITRMNDDSVYTTMKSCKLCENKLLYICMECYVLLHLLELTNNMMIS